MKRISTKMCRRCKMGTINSYSPKSTTGEVVCPECKTQEILGSLGVKK